MYLEIVLLVFEIYDKGGNYVEVHSMRIYL
jgi:hypothetical protein